jgi:hypothetical protein
MIKITIKQLIIGALFWVTAFLVMAFFGPVSDFIDTRSFYAGASAASLILFLSLSTFNITKSRK